MEEYEGIELRAYLAVIRRWLWLIVLGTVLAGGTALIVSARTAPIYQAEATVSIMRSQAVITFEPQFETVSEVFGDRVKSLSALVKNSAVASQVIEELGSTLDPGERKVEALLGMVAAEPDGELIKILAKADSPEKAAAIANAWARAYEEYVNRLYEENALTLGDVQAQAAEAEKSYQQAEEALAKFMGDSQIDGLQREINAKQELTASHKDAFITTQTKVAEAWRSYKQAEEALAQFLGDNRIDELNREIQAKQNTLADYYAAKRQLDNLIADAKALRDQLQKGGTSSADRDSLSLLLIRANAATLASGQPAELQFSLGQLSALEENPAQHLSELEALVANLEAWKTEIERVVAKSPLQQEILQLQKYLEEEQARKRELTQARDLVWETYQTLVSEAADLDVLASDPVSRLIDQYSQEVLVLQERLEREQARQRELTQARDLTWETYQTLVRKAAEVKVAAQVKESEVRFAVAAIEPANPIKPKKMQNTLLASVVGAMLAVGVSFLVEYLDDSIRTPEDVRRALGLSTLSSIAPLPAGVDGGLITLSQPRSPTSEGFRALRTQIQIATDKPLNTLLVTSPNPLEGKSTIVANLGIVMAQAGWSTILVDSDMRRPVLHEMFGLPNTQGLSTALSGDGIAPGQYLQATEAENLRVLTSGPLPLNPSELLSSPRMEELTQQLGSVADILLFDSPAALPVTDAALLAKELDGVLLVVESGATRRGTAQESLEGLAKVGANLVGIVLNRFSPGAAAKYYYEGDQAQRRRKSNIGPRPFGRLLGDVTRRIRGR